MRRQSRLNIITGAILIVIAVGIAVLSIKQLCEGTISLRRSLEEDVNAPSHPIPLPTALESEQKHSPPSADLSPASLTFHPPRDLSRFFTQERVSHIEKSKSVSEKLKKQD